MFPRTSSAKRTTFLFFFLFFFFHRTFHFLLVTEKKIPDFREQKIQRLVVITNDVFNERFFLFFFFFSPMELFSRLCDAKWIKDLQAIFLFYRISIWYFISFKKKKMSILCLNNQSQRRYYFFYKYRICLCIQFCVLMYG